MTKEDKYINRLLQQVQQIMDKNVSDRSKVAELQSLELSKPKPYMHQYRANLQRLDDLIFELEISL